ncbi:MAG TPA: protein kinase [Minicystis sp.]|nr:protein kinase [Minicystis sp.]
MVEDVFHIVGTTQGGSFHVERVVAEGGFSVVYRALHGAFRAPVALKCLKVPSDLTLAQRESYLERFREEAELLFRLSARIPEVVRPLHVDVIASKDGRFVPFLALEWLEGQSLADIITSRAAAGGAPMGLVKLVKLLSPVARALARAHRFPGPTGRVAIVHCDLKPENVFITRVDGREQARILDYGIAMAMRSAGRKATSPARPSDYVEPAFFTPGYAAPEQWSPRRFGATGPRTDVWGLALTLVEALTGTSPLGETSESKMKQAALDEAHRPTPRALGAVVSDEVEAAFARALAVQPSARTPDVPSFWIELEQALGLPPTFARRDDRQDPDDPPSWVSAPNWQDAAAASPPPPQSAPRSPLVRPNAAEPPRPDSAPELDLPLPPAGLSLEEPFAAFEGQLDFRPPASKKSGPRGPAAVDADDLEADIPIGASVPSPEPPASARGVVAPASEPPELEAPPPSRAPRSQRRPEPPAAEALRDARDDPGESRLPLEFDLAHERRPAAAPALVVTPTPAPRIAPRVPAHEPAAAPGALRTPVRLMIAGGVVAVAAVVGAQSSETLRALGALPKVAGVGLFGAGLLLLFWRLLDR